MRIHIAWLGVSLLAGGLAGERIGRNFDSKMVIDLRNNMGDAINQPAFLIGDCHPSKFVGLMVIGGSAWIKAAQERKVPPRCREVPKGGGCIDWLDPGEKDFPKPSLNGAALQ